MFRFLLVAFALLISIPASAQDCAPFPGADPRLAEIPATQRLRFIRSAIDRDARQSETWRGAWTGSFLLVHFVAVNLVVFREEPKDRANFGASAVKVLLPLSQMTFNPPRVIRDARILASEPILDDVCAELARAEAILVRDVNDEAWVYKWQIHVFPALGNFVLAFGLGTFFEDNWETAAVQSISGLIVNEIRIWSQPRGLIRTLADYRKGDLGSSAGRDVSWNLAPVLRRDSVGLRLAVQF